MLQIICIFEINVKWLGVLAETVKKMQQQCGELTEPIQTKYIWLKI